jgi:retrotransposon gag protein
MAFTNLMYLQGLDDPTWCKCFPSTLKGIAQQWFDNLPTSCVNNFKTLAYLFTSNFAMNIPAKKTTLDLGTIQQGEKEGLRSYIRRFNLMRIQIQGLPDEVAYTDFFRGLKDGSTFKFDLVRKRVATLQEALIEVEAYIQATDLCNTGKQSDGRRFDKKESRPKQSANKDEKKRK